MGEATDSRKYFKKKRLEQIAPGRDDNGTETGELLVGLLIWKHHEYEILEQMSH